MSRYALGRHVHHDERSRAFEVSVSKAKPKTVLWEHKAPVLDQGDLGSCTGNALAQWMNCEKNSHDVGRHYVDEQFAIEIYSAATKIDGVDGEFPPTDTGSTGLAVCKAAKTIGYLSGYRWAFSFNGLLAALQTSPVITGTDWYDGMFTPDADGHIKPTGKVAGGHEYLILGCDVQGKYLTILNSWGKNWGEGGRAKISFADFQKLQGTKGDVTIPVLR